MINIDKLMLLHKNNVANWHTELLLSEEQLPWKYIEENSQYNFLLWHEEDIARIKEIELSRIVEAKRSIDKFNQLRNNAIEKIDDWILNQLYQKNNANSPMHSETPGMMIDRLSIMCLKRYHMFEETIRTDAAPEHIIKCKSKMNVLDEQMSDLANCLSDILRLLDEGKLKFKVYRQFKMYNDPTLNPELYKRQKK